MKSLKRNLLALAIVGTPFAAQAELQPIDDARMGSITGQAGVTIELETKVNIGEFVYTDEGSLSIKDISIGGANRTDLFEEITDPAIRNLAFGTTSDLIDNIKIEIDVASDGDAIINVWPITAAPIDFGVKTGEWSLQGTTDSTLLANNFSMVGAITKMRLRVDTATDTLNLDTEVGISDLDVDIPFLAVGIRDLKLTGDQYLENPSILTLGAKVNMDIYNGQRADGTDALAVDLNTFNADMTIGEVLVGGTSIGSFTLDNLSVQNTSLRIYGHP
ncbi:hypothetical protein KUV44_12345 [Marinobacter daepoensis]|uniref:DUF6160 domain-containing protein n=1 Tax=Marinobacter daepoensis TaxID=262077 RepID=A0ABS3BHP0_9GAMM|nr:DUF6160 family protein [Marinobacter daepoensis]MBN7771331.1 hypothetical protein [Marinobacter daepoensis]MBY6079932.1 hypothetical protein [Marinobacter daepoensis]